MSRSPALRFRLISARAVRFFRAVTSEAARSSGVRTGGVVMPESYPHTAYLTSHTLHRSLHREVQIAGQETVRLRPGVTDLPCVDEASAVAAVRGEPQHLRVTRADDMRPGALMMQESDRVF